MKISSIRAIEILDSRGNPTLETTVELDNGVSGTASVPSGASTGSHEAVELRDGDKKHYDGMGVLKAINHVNGIMTDHLKGCPIDDLKAIDRKMIELDGTENKSRLGANAILSISLASARTQSLAHGIPLWKTLHNSFFGNEKHSFPRLMVNIVNGGKHANWAFDIQEFMIIPKTDKPSSAVETASEIFHKLDSLLTKDGYSTLKGDEGGDAPKLSSNEEVFEYIERAIEKAGFNKDDVDLGIDAAASEFCKEEVYTFFKTNRSCNRDELAAYYKQLIDRYGIWSFEDPFAEDDWLGFAQFTKQYGYDHLVVGDDLYTTNVARIQRGIAEESTNAVLIKLNQIGTLSETVEAIKLTKQAGWKVIISHRSGDTEDSFIADLAYASGADFLKAGSMSRSERLVKYNRLIEIEKN